VIKVLIVTNSVSGGGAEKVMNSIANELYHRGFNVSIVAINKSAYNFSEIKCDLIEIERNWNDGFFRTLTSWFKFNNIVSNLKPDLLILNCDLPELFGALLPYKNRIISVEHSQNPWRTRPKFGKIIRRILHFKKVVWVAVSSNLNIWPSGYKPVKVILNPINETKFVASKSISSVSRLVFVGRITWQKNPQAVIRIAGLLNLPALFIGEGVDAQEIIDMAQESNVALEMIGFKADPWLSISGGDILLVPSRFEGDGLVVLEALQRNIPLIISDIPEFRRFNLPNHNYASTDENYANLIRASMLNSSMFRVSPIIAKQILSSRDIKLICDSWISLIQSQLN
jgi:glycosyltransferase involved in cell wall biosynthesis